MSLAETVLVLGIAAALAVAAYARERSGGEERAAATISVLQDGMRRYHRAHLGSCAAPTPAQGWVQFTAAADLRREGIIAADFTLEPAGAHWQLQVGRYGNAVGIGRIAMSFDDLTLARRLAPRYAGRVQGGDLHLAFPLEQHLELGLAHRRFFHDFAGGEEDRETCLQT